METIVKATHTISHASLCQGAGFLTSAKVMAGKSASESAPGSTWHGLESALTPDHAVSRTLAGCAGFGKRFAGAGYLTC